MLESLTLQSCILSCLDLSESPGLRRLDLEFFNSSPRKYDPSKYPSKDDYQVMMQTMLENLQNVEKLTVVLNFLQMLSVAEFHGVPFPTLKVKTLTLKTTILQSAVPGIAKLLQNSPELTNIILGNPLKRNKKNNIVVILI
ncbi:hypothetical protein F2Q68_00019884 [Brassica cretica]|uniref:FBD domain-containing protein n=1 Tax=Brassica cretica TaxID=69181 RepID=A0A8S9FSV5_BRACR|nr:hypothetical protein F2Q68_00019884 [Brassica cretica]